MAWTTPRTWATGDDPTAALFNTHLRDNLNALRDSLLGFQDLGGNWQISTGRELHFADLDVAHGITTVLMTDEWGAIAPISGTQGGMSVVGISDADQRGLNLLGINGSAAPTTSAINIVGQKKNGTGVVAFAASEKVIQFLNDTTLLGRFYGSGAFEVVEGLAVGFSGVAGADEVQVGDANFKLDYDAGGPSTSLVFDSGDNIFYGRTLNFFQFNVGGTPIAVIDATTVDVAGLSVGTASWGDGLAGSVVMAEVAAPATPGANLVRIYCEDNGAGKSRVMAKFQSGAAQVMATEP